MIYPYTASIFDSDAYGVDTDSEEEEYEQPDSRWDVEADNDEDYCRSFEV